MNEDKYKEMKAARRRRDMGRSSLLSQADAIATHYLAMMTMAKHVIKMTTAIYTSPEPADYAEKCLEDLVDAMKEAHLEDFGIPLEWPEPSESGPFDGRRTCPRCGDRKTVADFMGEICVRCARIDVDARLALHDGKGEEDDEGRDDPDAE